MLKTSQPGAKAPLLFVRIASRLGLLSAPKGEVEENKGVEFGPQAILDPVFLQAYPHHSVLDLSFPLPDQLTPEIYLDTLAHAYTDAIASLSRTLTTDTTLVCVGGDHSVALASLASILQIHDPHNVGIVMIDSHGDIHQPSTSPSGNFHGMWLRPVIDHFEHKGIDALVPNKVPPSHLLYIGNLDIEQEEQDFIHKHTIATFDKKSLRGGTLTTKIDYLIQHMDHIHISLDIDVFSHIYAPATGMRIAHGLSPSDIRPILDQLRRARSYSLDLVEVNPTLTGGTKTVRLAQQMLTTMLNDK